ncbi:MAG: protein translocase subunit SecD [Proteobacteria bacterium]|nr:protein translocase subunit SecD [Pseudomonadota bacterium]
MERYPLWKHAIVAALVLTAVLYALPTAYSKSPTIQVRAVSSGADGDILNESKNALDAAEIPFRRLSSQGDTMVAVFKDAESQIAARATLGEALGDDYVVALNSVSNAPSWLTSLGANPIALGLDLRGGVYFLLQVNLSYAENRRLKGLVDEMKTELRRLGATDIRLEEGSIALSASSIEVAERLLAYIENEHEDIDTPTDAALDMQLELTSESKNRITDLTMEQNLQTLRNRVDELGVAEPVITRQGVDRIVVQLPGVQDTAQAKGVLGRTAALELRSVNEAKTQSQSLLRRAIKGRAPAGTELFYDRNGTPLLLDDTVVIEGDNIADARPGYDNRNQPAVHVSLDGSGANNMKRHTRPRVGQRLAILLSDNNKAEVISAPVINEELFANFMISGAMNSSEAAELALLLRAGALAAPLEIIEERTVGPSLGADNIASGLSSVAGGFIAIALFIVLYYAVFGAISVAALLINVILLTALLGIVGATLTLPGLAGFALTLGMAIDANVLINERIREEYDGGKTPLASINAGYGRAFTTILDANITTLIAGIALFAFGSGPVRGFAVVLCFGLLTSMFSAVQASRSLVNLAYERGNKPRRLLLGLRALNLKRVLQLMKWRRVTGVLSAVFLVICIGSLAVRGLNLGVDFTGGTILEVGFQSAPNSQQVRAAVAEVGLENAPIQISDDGLVLVKAPPSADGVNLSSKLLVAMKQIDPAADMRRIEYVGPQIGDELFIAGALALLCVMLGIMLYLSFRFKWHMAIGAIIANIHDVVFILGLFSLFQWEFSLPVLAAILAILGYSVNESVVIFDRVRENFRGQRRAEGNAVHTLDTAITQTWARTIITHGSTQLAVLAMLFFGGDALYLFALALTIGIFSSIYSSVLVAGPVALALGLNRDDFIEEADAKIENETGAVV